MRFDLSWSDDLLSFLQGVMLYQLVRLGFVLWLTLIIEGLLTTGLCSGRWKKLRNCLEEVGKIPNLLKSAQPKSTVNTLYDLDL